MRILTALLLPPLLFIANYAAATGHGCSGHGHGSAHGHSGGHGHSYAHSSHTSYHHRSAGVRSGVRVQADSRPSYVPPSYDGRWNNYGGKLSLHSAITRIPDPQGNLLPIGAEYFLSHNWSIAADAYIPIYKDHLSGTPGDEDYTVLLKDRRYSAEGRWYFHDNNYARAFMGLEAYYRNEVESIDSGGYVQRGNMYSYGHATVTKESTGVGLIVGEAIHVYAGLMLELYAGIGVRVHSTWQDDIIRLRDDGPDTCSCASRPDNNIIGTKASIYAPIGVKLSWTFGKMPGRGAFADKSH